MNEYATHEHAAELDEGPDVAIVFVTWPADRPFADFARTLLDEQLAACVNGLPAMHSVYVWEGERCEETERQLILKTRRTAVPRLLVRVRALHPYDVPEFLVLPVAAASRAYASWVGQHVPAAPGAERA